MRDCTASRYKQYRHTASLKHKLSVSVKQQKVIKVKIKLNVWGTKLSRVLLELRMFSANFQVVGVVLMQTRKVFPRILSWWPNRESSRKFCISYSYGISHQHSQFSTYFCRRHKCFGPVTDCINEQWSSLIYVLIFLPSPPASILKSRIKLMI